MAEKKSALPMQAASLFQDIAKRSALESGGDPLRRLEIMQGYMGQATPQVLEATTRESARRQRREVGKATAMAGTEGMETRSKMQFDMNRAVHKEAQKAAKQAALISAGATLLGKMASVGIDKWKKEKAAAKAEAPQQDLAPEPLLKALGAGAEQPAPEFKPPLWDENMDPGSEEAGNFVINTFFGGDPARYDQWVGALRGEKPRDWRGVFDMLLKAKWIPRATVPRPAFRSYGPVPPPQDPVNDFGNGVR